MTRPATSPARGFRTTLDRVFGGRSLALVKALPAGATGIKVAEPAIGDRDQLGGGTRVTDVSIAGAVVTISILADGPTICDPARTGIPPGEPVEW